MLIPKPIINYYRSSGQVAQRREQEAYIPLSVQSESGDDQQDIELLDGSKGTIVKAANSGHDEHSFTDDVVHQMIETIEFVLGSVSHTASYLRTWALSLAHQQLALVFLQKTVYNAMQQPAPFNAISIYISFAMLAVITFGFLIIMDLMECALHTLRLHWVEFQSKFFKGDGHRFQPFCHKTLLLGPQE
jgi:V-type H+-transporting ATPase subunit a